MLKCTEHGLPERDELEVINEFQQYLVTVLSEVTTIHEIGHFTGGYRRTIYIYLPEPENIHVFLETLAKQTQVREFEYKMSKDPTWKAVPSLAFSD